jgi:tRNA U54 and U55 pseudouridine synthase Pus10
MIKQFVGGREYTKPSVSEIIGSRCECISFDILDVYIQ